MCIAAPARVLAVEDGTAVVDVAGRRRRASTLMTPGIEAGAWVLVAAGNVVRRIDAKEASALAAELEAARMTAERTPDGRQPAPAQPGGSQ